jgi:hypothetical protein
MRLNLIGGYGKLLTAAVTELTGIVESMHGTIAAGKPAFGAPPATRTRGTTRFVYERIRQVTQLVGEAVELLPAEALSDGAGSPSTVNDAVAAVLCGVCGDYLAESGSPLAIAMELRHGGRALGLEREALRAALPGAGSKVLVMVHGLSMNDTFWSQKGHDHGAALAADLGYTVLYLRYNSGLHISTNGRAFAAVLEELVGAWPAPITELSIVGHSLGGLVTRSAGHYAAAAGHTWPGHLQQVAFLGSPHHGAPLERVGNLVHQLADVSAYTSPLGKLGTLRCACITDLRHGYLRDEDWAGRDRFAPCAPPVSTVPLLPHVRYYALAGTLGDSRDGAAAGLFGDGMVQVDSSLGIHEVPALHLGIPPERQWVGTKLGHIELLHRRDVYEALRGFLAGA